MDARRRELLSNTMKRTSEWFTSIISSSYFPFQVPNLSSLYFPLSEFCRIFSQEIASDITVHVEGVSFSLHKFPLVSKCGYIRKLISNSKETLNVVKINDVPGGSKGFELAAKFCYGINFELTIENIAMARCVAEHLEMTEECSVNNLISRTEAYITEVGLCSFAGAVSILGSSERFMPVAENVKLITRCVDAIAALIVTKESPFSLSVSAESSCEGLCLDSSSSSLFYSKEVVDWWAEELVVLSIHTFQRVLLAMISRGFNNYALGPILMLYARKCLQDLEIQGKGKIKGESNQENDKRVILETIASLLPREKNAISTSFLSMLLRSAIYLETTVACRLDLEKRMGLQLGEAVLDDILIPSFRFDGDTLFDIDTVQRILMNFGEFERTCDELANVAKLMENYLAEIASDCNLSLSKFVNLAECIPDQRVTDDGMYKAVDIYLKAHPALVDAERMKLCSLINCQKLTAEACAHAAQNERLSAKTLVQVLYYEQQRLREAIEDGSGLLIPLPDDISSLQKENQDLKFELLKAKMRLKNIEKLNSDKSPSRTRSIISTMSKKFLNFTPILWFNHGVSSSITKSKNKVCKSRRHSIS